VTKQRTAVRRVRELVRDVFGHDDLLPGQADATAALLDGHDVLLLSATGSGKSLVYQAAGLLLGGCTVVVSPLLALQADQVRALEQAPGRRIRAARLSSAESESRRAETLAAAGRGEVDFVFVAPEQLAAEEVRRALGEAAPTLVAVDEAHCVSVWGSDFRPDYFRLGEMLADLGRPPVVAMTATAAPPVREDIVERLDLRECRTVVTGFARDELSLDVVPCPDEDTQVARVLELVTGAPAGAVGIVYCRTRPAAERYAETIAQAGGRRVAVYHGGLSQKRRRLAHEAFSAGEIDTVVATSAFGMGIDKPDIRFVVHAQVPESPDTYYQEVGRAGRDGEPATGTLLYRSEDLALGRFFSGGIPREEDVGAVLAAVEEVGEEPTAVQEATGLGRRKAGRILNLRRLALTTRPGGLPETVAAVLDIAESQRKLDRSRVEMMRAYAEGDRCRSQFLLRYLGDAEAERCGRCDRCRAGVAVDETAAGYALQSAVTHPEFGDGVVTDVESDRVTVLFDDVGYRTLALDVVAEEGLLEQR
jgi:ATP-dependent DNA helicase RecQ